MPDMYIIASWNGAGKTTPVYTQLPVIAETKAENSCLVISDKKAALKKYLPKTYHYHLTIPPILSSARHPVKTHKIIKIKLLLLCNPVVPCILPANQLYAKTIAALPFINPFRTLILPVQSIGQPPKQLLHLYLSPPASGNH